MQCNATEIASKLRDMKKRKPRWPPFFVDGSSGCWVCWTAIHPLRREWYISTHCNKTCLPLIHNHKKRTNPLRKINNKIECNISCHLLWCSMLQICFVLHSINSGNYHYANIFIASLFPASFHLLFLLLLCTFVAADAAAVCCIFKYKSIPALS